MDVSTISRIWNRCEVDPKTGCWNWGGCLQGNGYGRIRSNGKTEYTHRAMFIAVYGDIQGGLDVCHTCDNRSCSNPIHLFSGSRLVNMQDAVSKNRQAQGQALSVLHQGEKTHLAKLTDESVLEIRRLIGNGAKVKDLALKFECSKDNIVCIIKRKTWRHI